MYYSNILTKNQKHGLEKKCRIDGVWAISKL